MHTFFLATVAALGGFLFGFDSGVINGAVGALRKVFAASDLGTGFSVASMLLGCGMGAFAAGRAADAIGRKRVMTGTALLFLVSAWGSGIADGELTFVIFRLIGGVAVGAASVVAPAYISEIAPASSRGSACVAAATRHRRRIVRCVSQ